MKISHIQYVVLIWSIPHLVTGLAMPTLRRYDLNWIVCKVSHVQCTCCIQLLLFCIKLTSSSVRDPFLSSSLAANLFTRVIISLAYSMYTHKITTALTLILYMRTYNMYCSVPGMRPFPGKHPCTCMYRISRGHSSSFYIHVNV